MKKRWMLRQRKIDIKALSKSAAISDTIATILVNRGISKVEDINKFLNVSLDNLHDSYLMKDMDKGSEIIKKSIEENKKITIYGDYDADGVTSTVILYKALKKCGAKVNYYIPDRETEGYGMYSDRVEKLKQEGTDVILTCDNGISALEPIELAKKLGLTVVVTDHHELPFVEDEKGNRNYILPKADAIINPKQKDCEYPFKMLCGAGIAFKFAMVLFKKMNITINDYEELLEFAAIGTICDVVDLKDENRIIAKLGLKYINNTNNLGLRALIKETFLENKKISSYNIGFVIGPCINATGRLDSAKTSVELFLTNDEKESCKLAKELKSLNEERQQITVDSVEKVVDIIENSSLKEDKILLVYDNKIHESIAGIVAGRIKDMYNRPTIILTTGKGMPKGSGRSIEEYNLFEELIKCKELINKFGGHPMAAGLTVEEKNIDALRKKLNENCSLIDENFIPKITIDKRVPLSNVNLSLIEELEKLEPFGKGNASPLMAEKNILVSKIKILGKDENTLKLYCKMGNSERCIDALAFGKAKEFVENIKLIYKEKYKSILDSPLRYGLKLDLIYYPSINEFNGIISTQIKIIDYRFCSK